MIFYPNWTSVKPLIGGAAIPTLIDAFTTVAKDPTGTYVCTHGPIMFHVVGIHPHLMANV
jgi:hypothetical protein